MGAKGEANDFSLNMRGVRAGAGRRTLSIKDAAAKKVDATDDDNADGDACCTMRSHTICIVDNDCGAAASADAAGG